MGLLDCLDNVAGGDIKSWFRRNFMMDTHAGDADALSLAMAKLLCSQSERHEEYHTFCLEFFYDYNQPAAEPKAKKLKQGVVHKHAAPGRR